MRALLLATLALLVLVPAASAAGADRLAPAEAVLAATGERLALMRGVMATKWVSRAPIEDTAQEATVLAGARAAAEQRGLDPAGVEAVFAEQIAAAKVVQLGWGSQWLLHGFPADEPVPELVGVRAELAALSPRIADALAATARAGTRCERGARTALRRASGRLVAVAHVTRAARIALVDAILRVRPAGASAACGPDGS